MIDELQRDLRRDEGDKDEIYADSRGFLTAGIGHRLIPGRDSEVGMPPGTPISPEKKEAWFRADVDEAVEGARAVADRYGIDFDDLPKRTQITLGNMTFQMGATGVAGFKDMWGSLKAGNFGGAADAMLASNWRKQTPNRAHRLAWEMRRSGRDAARAKQEPPPQKQEPSGGGLLDRIDRAFTDLSESLDTPPLATFDEFLDAPLSKALPFFAHHGFTSLPHMAAVMVNLPAYVIANAGGMAKERALNNAAEKSTVKDLFMVLPWAATSGVLERIGAQGIFKGKTAKDLKGVVREIVSAGSKEAVTEGLQTASEYTGTRLGTPKEWDAGEMARQMAEGATAGFGIGSAIRGTTAAGEALQHRPQIMPQGSEPGPAVDVTPGAPGAGQPQLPPGPGPQRALPPGPEPQPIIPPDQSSGPVIELPAEAITPAEAEAAPEPEPEEDPDALTDEQMAALSEELEEDLEAGGGEPEAPEDPFFDPTDEDEPLTADELNAVDDAFPTPEPEPTPTAPEPAFETGRGFTQEDLVAALAAEGIEVDEDGNPIIEEDAAGGLDLDKLSTALGLMDDLDADTDTEAPASPVSEVSEPGPSLPTPEPESGEIGGVPPQPALFTEPEPDAETSPEAWNATGETRETKVAGQAVTLNKYMNGYGEETWAMSQPATPAPRDGGTDAVLPEDVDGDRDDGMGNTGKGDGRDVLDAQYAVRRSSKSMVSRQGAGLAGTRFFDLTQDAVDAMGGISAATPDGMRRSVDFVLKRGRDSGHEHTVMVDMKTGDVGAGTNHGSEEMDIPRAHINQMKNPDRQLVILHNHPGNGPLSGPDLVNALGEGVRAVVAVGHDGAVSAVRLSDTFRNSFKGLPEERAAIVFRSRRRTAENAVMESLRSRVDNGSIARDRARVLVDEMRARLLADMDTIRYASNFEFQSEAERASYEEARRRAGIVRQAGASSQYVFLDKGTDSLSAFVEEVRPKRRRRGGRTETSQRLAGRPGTAAAPQPGLPGEAGPEVDDDTQFRPGRKNVGDRVVEFDPRIAPTGKPVSRETAIKDLIGTLGFSVYVGRMKGRDAVGFFKPATEELRLKNHGDIETLIHEVGHLIDKRFPDIKKTWKEDATVREELRQVSYDDKKTSEGFAEFMRMWATQPELAVRAAPEFSQWWEKWLDAHPKEGAALRQFKQSALDWFGQSAEDRLASKIGGAAMPMNEKIGMGAIVRDWAHRFRQAVVDDLHGIGVAETAVAGEKGEVYMTARLIRGAGRMVEEAIMTGPPRRLENGDIVADGPGLKEIMEPVKDDLDSWIKYAVAVSAAELRGQGRENLFKLDEIQAGLRLHTPERNAVFQAYQEFNGKLLDFAESSGILDPEARKAFQRHFYLPFYRVETALTDVFRPLKGGTANLNPIMENIVKNASMIIQASVKNEAMQGIAYLAGMDKGGHFLAKIPRESKTVTVQKAEIVRVAKNALQEGAWGSEDIMQAMGDQALNALAEGLRPMVEVWQHGQAPQGKSVVAVMYEGKADYYEVVDPLLLRAIQAFTRPPTAAGLRPVVKVKNFMRDTITMLPEFQIPNLMRDSIQAFVMSRSGFRPFLDSARGLAARIQNDPAYHEAMINGAGFSTMRMDEDHVASKLEGLYRRKGLKRKIMAGPRGMWEAAQLMGEAMELAARLGEYKRLRAQGKTAREAAYAAREISVDFGMKGDSQVMGALYDMSMFFKAAVLSTDRLGRAMTTDEKRGAVAIKTGLVVMAGMALWALNSDNPLWDETPDWDRDFNWHFFIPTPAYYQFVREHGREPETAEEAEPLFTHFVMPKIWEIGLLSTIAERSLEEVVGNADKDNGKAMLRAAAGVMGMDPTPAFLKPAVELATNYSFFTGRAIEDPGMKRLAPHLRAKPWSSEIGKKVSRGLKDTPINVSPVQFDHLFRGYANYLGLYSTLMTDKALAEAPADKRWDQMPVVRRFMRSHPGLRTYYGNQLQEMLRAADEAVASARHATKAGDTQEAQEQAARPEIQWQSGLKNTADALRNARGYVNSVMRSRDLGTVREAAQALAADGIVDAAALKQARTIGALKRLIQDSVARWSGKAARDTIKEVRELQRAVQ